MKSTRKGSRRDVAPNLFRLTILTLIVVATPSIAYADAQTQIGLESLAASIGYLATAVAFAGSAIAIAIYLGLRSRRQD